MAKLFGYNEFKNIGGGLNQAISNYQTDSDESIIAKNILFERYGTAGKLKKRVGKSRVTAEPMPGKIDTILPFTLNDENYLQYYVKGTSNDYMYEDGVDANGDPVGSPTALLTIPSSSLSIDFELSDNILYGGFPENTTEIDNCVAAASSVLSSGAWIGTFEYSYISSGATLTAALSSTLNDNLNLYVKGTKSYEVKYANDLSSAGILDGQSVGFIKTYAVTSDIADNVVALDLMINSELRDQRESDLYKDDYNPSMIEIILYNKEVGGSYVNGASYTFSTSSDEDKFVTQTFSKYIVDPASTEDENGWVYEAISSGFTPSEGLGRLEVKLHLNGDLEDTSRTDGSLLIDNINYKANVSGLMYFDGTEWKKIFDTILPDGINKLADFDGSLWVEQDGTLYYSYPSDGTNFKGGGSFGLNSGDGDAVTEMKILGDSLFIFKQHSILKITPTTNFTIPYKVSPVYSSDITQKGVGCIAGKTAKNVVLGTPGDDYLGALEYILFMSDEGLYAIGSQGAPIVISKRVKPLVKDPDVTKSKCFAAIDPKENAYILCLADNADDSSRTQLSYSIGSKAYSTFDFTDVTALSEVRTDTNSYMLIGDKDGYVFNYSYPTEYALTNYADEDQDGIASAIEAIYQTKYSNYGNDGNHLQAQDLQIGSVYASASATIDYRLINEKGNVASGELSLLNAARTGEVCILKSTSKLYGKYISTEFTNNTINNDLAINFWLLGAHMLNS